MKVVPPSVDRSESMPLYYQIYQYILGQVIPAHKVDLPLPSDDEISLVMKVSKGTVRLAFNLLEREGILTRIPGKGTFLRADYALRLKKYRIGVVLPSYEFGDQMTLAQNWVHHIEIINGFMVTEDRLNVVCSLVVPESLQGARFRDFDGFVRYPGVEANSFQSGGLPSVALEYTMDFLAAFGQMARHAAQAGCRHPVFLGYPQEGRLDAVNSALEASGLGPIPTDRVVVCEGLVTHGREACRQLLSRGIPFDAILCSTDLRAVGVLETLEAAGVCVPADVAVYGLDGIPQGEACMPPLTTVAFDWQYPGRRALEQIRALLDGRDVPLYEAPTGRFVARQSTR